MPNRIVVWLEGNGGLIDPQDDKYWFLSSPPQKIGDAARIILENGRRVDVMWLRAANGYTWLVERKLNA